MTDKEQVIQVLRATLLSVKGALTIEECNRDYRELQGEWIPFRKLGYPSLEKLFLDVPGLVINQVNGKWLVDAIAKKESQHLAAMVARQKPSKKSNPRHRYPERFPRKQLSWRKPSAYTNNTSNYNENYSNKYYRAKSGASFNNNNSYSYKTSQLQNSHREHNEPNIVITKTNNISTETKNSGKKYSDSSEIKHSITNKEIRKENKPKTKISASQRLTNLRETVSPIDLIPLQLPAANNQFQEESGPVTHITPACNLELPPNFNSSVDKLEWTCRKLGLQQPSYKTHEVPVKRGSGTVFCNIKVGTYSASSYPDSAPSEELAKNLAAVKLLTIIESSEALGLPTSSSSKAIAGLIEVVSEHEAGTWASDIPHLYRHKYNENLPSNWQELVENCPQISMDRVANGLLILVPNTEQSSPVYMESIINNDTIDSDLPGLQFPEEHFWNVYITVANSTLEIWLRIIGEQYSNAFESLLADMSDYYHHYGTIVDKSMLIKNAWYAVNLDDGGWQRAKILEIDDDAVTVFLGDHGDDDTVAFDMIKILEPQFRKLPAQAILCRLEGAEELAASELGVKLVQERLPGQSLVAVPSPRHDTSDPSIALVLYDTSTPRDLNINKEIIHDFCIAGAFTITQKLCQVEVGCVTEEGRIWVSRAGGGALVSAALALLTVGPYRRPLPGAPAAPAPNTTALYIVRTIHGDWVRCTIISGLDGEGTVRTQLVDSGLILRAPLSSLVPLQTFSPALNAFPHQAVEVRLGAADRLGASMVSRLRDLVLDTPVVCRALQASAHPASPPNVELYVRTGPQNILASVNNALITEHDLIQDSKSNEDPKKEATNHVEALTKKKERIFRTQSSSGMGASDNEDKPHIPHYATVLPPPVLPAPGKCFDVYIAMAANPWNFVVQPNSTRHNLQTMMKSLQEECPKFLESDAPNNPASGELYTVYYDKDQSWYRVTVAGNVSSEMVTAYFCDYGDLYLFPNKSLRPVPFSVPLARSLPPQAIKARLYNVRPLHKDWTVEDCIRFQELCVEKQFVGICKDINKDPLNPNEPLLTLDLIDTSTDDDIYLNKLLIADGRAVSTA